jgi:hypothetical protein
MVHGEAGEQQAARGVAVGADSVEISAPMRTADTKPTTAHPAVSEDILTARLWQRG